MIKPFDSGRIYILDLSFKLISLLVIWLYNCNNVAKKNITHLGTLIVWVCQSTLNVFPQWISKPWIRKPKNHRKSNRGAGRFAQNLRAYKNHIMMYETVNLGDTIDVTLSSVTGHNTSPFLPTFHITAWWLKEGRKVIPNFLLLVDEIKCFILSIIANVIMFLNKLIWTPIYQTRRF